MKVNTHGLKMVGLKAAAGDTKCLANCGGYYSGHYIQISYDRVTGEILTTYLYFLGQNEWSVYHDPNVITIGNVSAPITMQGIANMIAHDIEERDAEEKYCREAEEYQRSLYER